MSDDDFHVWIWAVGGPGKRPTPEERVRAALTVGAPVVYLKAYVEEEAQALEKAIRQLNADAGRVRVMRLFMPQELREKLLEKRAKRREWKRRKAEENDE